MLDWNELLIIGAAALIFIGPKELPGALRTMGKFVAKARGMARDFQTNVDDMVREAELDEVKKQVQKLGDGGLERMVQDSVDPSGQIEKALQPPSLAAPVVTSTPAATTPVATTLVATSSVAEASTSAAVGTLPKT